MRHERGIEVEVHVHDNGMVVGVKGEAAETFLLELRCTPIATEPTSRPPPLRLAGERAVEYFPRRQYQCSKFTSLILLYRR